MGKSGAKIGSVHDCVAGGAGNEDILALRTVDVDGTDAGMVGLPNGEDGLHAAKNTGATTEMGGLEFLILLCGGREGGGADGKIGERVEKEDKLEE